MESRDSKVGVHIVKNDNDNPSYVYDVGPGWLGAKDFLDPSQLATIKLAIKEMSEEDVKAFAASVNPFQIGVRRS